MGNSLFPLEGRDGPGIKRASPTPGPVAPPALRERERTRHRVASAGAVQGSSLQSGQGSRARRRARASWSLRCWLPPPSGSGPRLPRYRCCSRGSRVEATSACGGVSQEDAGEHRERRRSVGRVEGSQLGEEAGIDSSGFPGSVTRFGGPDSARVAGLHIPFSHHANASSYNGSDCKFTHHAATARPGRSSPTTINRYLYHKEPCGSLSVGFLGARRFGRASPLILTPCRAEGDR